MWQEQPTEWLSLAGTFLFFVLAPLVVWKGSRITVDATTVAVRAGIGLWHRLPREEITAVRHGAAYPTIVGSGRALVLRTVWTTEQLDELATFLGVPLQETNWRGRLKG